MRYISYSALVIALASCSGPTGSSSSDGSGLPSGANAGGMSTGEASGGAMPTAGMATGGRGPASAPPPLASTGGAGDTGGAFAGASGALTGAGGAGGTGGTGGMPDPGYPSFDPCPAAPSPCVLLPLGDSITDGYSASDAGGYRSRLFQLALANGKNITFTGSVSGGPATVDSVVFPADHEGHSGASIDNLVQFVAPGLQPEPDIILIMAGTNGCDAEIDIGDCMAGLVDAALNSVPNALIVVAKVTPTNPDYLGELNSKIPSIVSSRANAGKHVIMADLYSPFLANPNYGMDYLVDYAHPSDLGYQVMAEAWYSAIAPYLQ